MDPRGQEYQPAVPVDTLHEHPLNPRRGDVESIERSLQAHGFYGAVLAQRSSGAILAGNHRYRAATRKGLKTLPVIWLDVDDDQAKRILLIDNRTSDFATYDDEALAEALRALVDSDLGLEGTGFTDEDLAALGMDATQVPGATDPDDVPERAPAITFPGDVWLLGPHRLMCGDSTALDHVEHLVQRRRADAVWTDPPYGVSYVGKTKDELTIENDGDADFEKVLNGALDSLLAATNAGAPVYVAAPSGPAGIPFAVGLEARGLFRQKLVWVKDALVLGHSDYHYRHEDIYYGFTPGGSGRRGRGGEGWHGDNSQTTVLEFARPKASREHPTMKPTALIAYCLDNSTKPGDVVLDLFGGSGSTLMAAHGMGRQVRLMELDPHYCDVICRRFEEHTGTLPQRDGKAISFLKDD